MAITYEIEAVSGVLHVSARGFDETLEQVQAYSMAVIGAAIEHQCRRVLSDERALEYRLGTMDTFELAQAILAAIPDAARVALVVSAHSLRDAAFFEDVVVNRGLTLRIFTDYDAASAWIGEA